MTVFIHSTPDKYICVRVSPPGHFQMTADSSLEKYSRSCFILCSTASTSHILYYCTVLAPLCSITNTTNKDLIQYLHNSYFRPNRIVLPPVSCVYTIEAWLISLWQQLPSSMKQTKSKVKSFITDGHIEQSWCLVTTSIKANIDYLV